MKITVVWCHLWVESVYFIRLYSLDYIEKFFPPLKDRYVWCFSSTRDDTNLDAVLSRWQDIGSIHFYNKL